MLPPGHIAGGYLVSVALLKYTHNNFTAYQIKELLLIGTFFGFAPDIDFFFSFYRARGLVVSSPKDNHRKFYSHAPILWFLAGAIIFLAASNPFYRYVGLLVWLGSWSHFFLDSIEYGIMWLWPLNSRIYAFKDAGREFEIVQKDFSGFWISFVKRYAKKVSFYLEMLVIVIALITFIKR